MATILDELKEQLIIVKLLREVGETEEAIDLMIIELLNKVNKEVSKLKENPRSKGQWLTFLK